MMHSSPSPVVHLKPHAGAAGSPAGSSSAGTNRPSWLPYVEVTHFDEVTERAHRFGAGVLLQPREGPAGWRSVIRRARGP
jgi:predicted enzyme related to lactoylglutathione lyase